MTLYFTKRYQNLLAAANDCQSTLLDESVHREGVEIPQGRGSLLDVEGIPRPNSTLVDFAADQALDRAALLMAWGVVPPKYDRSA